MSSILSSLNDLLTSFLSLIRSILQTFYDVVHAGVSAVLNFVAGFANMLAETVKGALQVGSGVGRFIVGNIVVLAVLGAAAFGYLVVQRRKGRTVTVGDKKIN